MGAYDIPLVIQDNAWEGILAARAGRSGDSLRTLVAGAFARHAILPPHVLDRLTDHPVAGG